MHRGLAYDSVFVVRRWVLAPVIRLLEAILTAVVETDSRRTRQIDSGFAAMDRRIAMSEAETQAQIEALITSVDTYTNAVADEQTKLLQEIADLRAQNAAPSQEVLAGWQTRLQASVDKLKALGADLANPVPPAPAPAPDPAPPAPVDPTT